MFLFFYIHFFCLHLTFPKQVAAIYYNVILGFTQWKTGIILHLIYQPFPKKEKKEDLGDT